MRTLGGTALLLFLAACATTGGIDMDEPRRLVGTARSVRIDAQITSEEIRPGAHVPVTWTITNDRPASIAVADLILETSWDEESRTFTVTVGSEVPGNELLPRLIEIGPGEQKTFTGSARLFFGPRRSADPRAQNDAAALRLRLNFLGDVEPFRQLIGMKENALADPGLADTLFPVWVEANEIVYTNSVPLRWGVAPAQVMPAAGEGRRRRM